MYEKKELSALLAQFRSQILRPYRDLSIALSEVPSAEKNRFFIYDKALCQLLGLKASALALIADSVGLADSEIQARFAQCIRLFLKAVELHIHVMSRLQRCAQQPPTQTVSKPDSPDAAGNEQRPGVFEKMYAKKAPKRFYITSPFFFMNGTAVLVGTFKQQFLISLRSFTVFRR